MGHFEYVLHNSTLQTKLYPFSLACIYHSAFESSFVYPAKNYIMHLYEISKNKLMEEDILAIVNNQ